MFWTAFIGFGAVAGSLGMLLDRSGHALGMDGMLPYFQVLPFADVLFRDFLFSGIALLLVNGVTNLLSFGLLLARKKIGIVLGTVFGVTLMLWICIQFYIFPANFLSTAYFIFGFLQTVCGYTAWVRYKQQRFRFDASKYCRIGKNPRALVVYFSREGYTEKAAYEEADKTGAEVYAVKTTEKIDGNLGFLWCGRFGTERKPMPIEKVSVDWKKYDAVTIFTPVWVFSLAAPVREFCKQASGKIKNVRLVCVHFTKGKYTGVRKECEALLQSNIDDYENRICRFGEIKK